jgi:hypothetical protein
MERATGEEGNEDMNKKTTAIKYTDEPIAIGERVPDFLPPPEVLAQAQVVERVTIGLNHEVLVFFRTEAKKHKVSYQRMIRDLLSLYVEQMGRK